MTVIAASRSKTATGGWIAVVGAALAVVGNAVILGIAPAPTEGLVSYPLEVGAFQIGQVFFALTQLLMLAGIVALARSGAAGGSRLGRVGGWLAIVGWAVTVPGALVLAVVAAEPVDSDGATLASSVYGIGVIVADIGLILFGAAMLRAKVWPGRSRWLPLALGLFELLVATPILLGLGFASPAAFVVITLTNVLVALIGVALIRGRAYGGEHEH